MTENQVVTLSVEFLKIPKKQIVKAENGKLYTKILCSRKFKTDEYGNNVKVWLYNKETNEIQYIGSGRLWNFQDAKDEDFKDDIELNVCLSDILGVNKKVVNTKEGKKVFLQLEVHRRKEADAYGNEFAILNQQTREQRERKEDKKYCGNGKLFKRAYVEASNDDFTDFYKDMNITGESGQTVPPGEDDLPF